MNRVNWDLRLPSKNIIELGQSYGGGGWFGGGFMAVPGTYTATLSKVENGEVTDLSEPMEFDVVPLREGTLDGADYDEMVAFQNDVIELQQALTAFENDVEKHIDMVKAMQTAYASRSGKHRPRKAIARYPHGFVGVDGKTGWKRSQKRNRRTQSAITIRSNVVGIRAMFTSLYGPTEMHKQMIEIGNNEFDAMKGGLNSIANRFAQFERQLTAIGAPPIQE